MKISKFEVKSLEIPFRVYFKHSVIERKITETIIVKMYSNDIIGYGEGCPRDYVSGENVECCIRFLNEQYENIKKIDSLQSLKDFVENNSTLIDVNPAAWCAAETAILDLLGKIENKSLEKLLDIPEVNGDFNYSAVLGILMPPAFKKELIKYLDFSLKDYKIKISGNLEVDAANITSLHLAIPDARIRLDANNLWHDVDQAACYLQALPQLFWAIEEPIHALDYKLLKNISDRIEYKIILDESCLKISDLDCFDGVQHRLIINVRISKMGGLLRSLKIAAECRKRGIELIVGAQVGETSILTRTAICLVNNYRDVVIAQEGAFGTHLLKYDIAVNSLRFGKFGKLRLSSANHLGLGLSFISEV